MQATSKLLAHTTCTTQLIILYKPVRFPASSPSSLNLYTISIKVESQQTVDSSMAVPAGVAPDKKDNLFVPSYQMGLGHHNFMQI